MLTLSWEILTMPHRRLGNRLVHIFREPPTWAEFTSAVGIFIYCFIALAGECFTEKDLHMWPSMQLISEIMTAWTWVTISFVCGSFQLFSILYNRRTLRFVSSLISLVWYIFIVNMNMPVNGYSPMMAFPIVLCVPNFLSIIRHARDWDIEIAGS